MNERFIRTCQSCGNKQEDIEPNFGLPLTDGFRNRKCKKCKSPDLDYGSVKYDDPGDED